MFILLLLIVSFTLSTNCMEAPPGKRKAQELLEEVKVARPHYFGFASLEGIPDDIKKEILEYVMSANAEKPPVDLTLKPKKVQKALDAADQAYADEHVNYTIKTNHPCFRINKKFAALSKQISGKLFGKLEQMYPAQFLQAANRAASSPNCSLLQRMVQASKTTIFNLTARMTPLMVAVGYNNEEGVKLLLAEANERNILKQYVNLDCGQEHNDGNTVSEDMWATGQGLKYSFFQCPVQGTPLHIACHRDNRMPTSVTILRKLLNSGANVHAQDKDSWTCLAHAAFLDGDATLALEKIVVLLQAGADPKIGLGGEGTETPEQSVDTDAQINNAHQSSYKAIQKLFKEHSAIKRLT